MAIETIQARTVKAELLWVNPVHHLEMLSERKAALERVTELEGQLATALRQYGTEVELKLVATIEIRDLRKRVRTALQVVREESNDVAVEALLQHIEEALDD